MCFTITAIIGADALFEFISRQQTRRLGDGTFAMHPLRLNRIQPGALTGQQACNQTHSLAGAFHLAVVRAEPVSNMLTLVPRGVIPNQEQGSDALNCQPLATPGQKGARQGAHWPVGHKAQEHLVCSLACLAHQHAITGQRFRARVVLGALQLLQSKLAMVVSPVVLLGLGEPAPPNLVGKAKRPGGKGGRQADQAVASLFFCT